MKINPKIKNAILFIGIAIVLVLIYVFFIKKPAPEEGLTSGNTAPIVNPNQTGNTTAPLPGSAEDALARDFLNILLSVRSITLNDAIFADVAFSSLRDSTIILVGDGNEGRPNPFAPIGSDPSDLLNIPIIAPSSGATPGGSALPVSP